MEQLTSVVIGAAVTVIVLVAIFSIVPKLMESFACPAVTGDTDADFVEDAGENWTDSDDVDQWKVSCSDFKTQSTIVPILLGLMVIIAILVVIVRMMQ